MTPDEYLLEYLRAVVAAVGIKRPGFRYASPYAFVLKHGKSYTPTARPVGFALGRAKQCFDNSLQLAVERELLYVEGFATFGRLAIPVAHAWCVAKGTNNVIDITWPEPGTSYIGVPIKLDYCKEQDGCVLDNWTQHWPILQTLTPTKAWQVPKEEQ